MAKFASTSTTALVMNGDEYLEMPMLEAGARSPTIHTKELEIELPTKRRSCYSRLSRFLNKKWVIGISFVIIFLGLAASTGYLSRYVRVLIDEKRFMDGHGIDDDLFASFNLAEQYAAAAYCPLNTNSSRSRVSCGLAGNCPLVEAAETITEVEFTNSLYTDVTGFVASDHTNKLVVISFRGSTSKKNFITDANYTQVTSDLCPNCVVHRGFWFSWEEARNQTLTALMSIAKANPAYKVVVTGHSLGGAIATLCAAEIRKLGYDASLYTFGSPRVGDSETAKFIGKQSNNNFRVTHYNDLVPRLPPLDLGHKLVRRDQFSTFPFVHLSPEYFIRTPTNVSVTTGDIDTYYGLVSYKGNTGQAVPSVEAHRWYFNNISSCGHFE